ncbi:antibiotic biosynthesis monooxygenase [Nocardiopsis sp. RSe5-2]|uniref:Antibiotic biosynthesis monooxygenase n=1 Tax=Nocardiopsis endophytica TaxID=3018445 RepID=A0ABT4TWM0_9ACTN|nr:antibiotic biosynthesis monooxygenase [Nocardiopsis endophytica]MDA2809094.1 antibiotic biosynthesis monooxygenase [Nocardiopsis endophytica]
MQDTAPLPFDVALARTGATVVGHWAVPDAARQREVADAVMEPWRAGPWPDGLLSVDAFLSTADKPQGEERLETRDSAVVVVSQWESPEDHDRHAARTAGPDVPGVAPPDEVAHRLYRGAFRRDLPSPVPGHEPEGGPDAEPGCIFIAEFEMADTESARLWSDAVYDAMEEAVTEHGALPGWISSHHFLDREGRRVFQYAAWATAEAHEAFLESGLRQDVLRRAGGLSKVKSAMGQRYIHAAGLRRGRAERRGAPTR